MALLISSVVLFVALVLFYIMDEERDNLVTYIVGLICLVIVCFLQGSDFEKMGDKKSKTIITPSLSIKCENGKCDTTYIYTFNNEK